MIQPETKGGNSLPLLEKTPTGIRGLDEIACGGLPKGRPTRVCGGAGCGKTMPGIEFLAHGIADYDEPGVDAVQIDRGQIEETGEYDRGGLFIRLGGAIYSIGARRVVLDAIKVLFAGAPVHRGFVRAERKADWHRNRPPQRRGGGLIDAA